MLIDGTATPTPAGDAGAGSGTSGAIDTSSMSDEQILDSPTPAAPAGDGAAPPADGQQQQTPPAGDAAKVDQGADDSPAWLKSITDTAAQAEARQIFEAAKAYREAFPDAAAAKAIAEVLPGGKEQLDGLVALDQQIKAQDAALASNDPAAIAPIVAEFLNGENAGTIFRASAQHMAQANPQAWAEIAGDLVKSTLQADGVGELFSGLGNAIKNEDADYVANFLKEAATWAEKRGLAEQGSAGKQQKIDPQSQRYKEEAEKATKANLEMKTTQWNGTLSNTLQGVAKSMNAAIVSALGNVLPKDAPGELKDQIGKEIYDAVNTQINANSWLDQQIKALIGSPNKPRFEATAEDWKKAAELSGNAAKSLVPSAAKKVIERWSKMTVLKSNDTAAKAAAAGQKTEINGAGPSSNRKAVKTPAELRAMSDEEILDM